FRDSVNTTMVTVLEAEKESAKTEKETQAAEKKLEIWNQLRGKGTYEITGNDTEIRPLMVDLQKKFEGVLANMSSYKKMPVVCVIHTPLPCTPLRVKLDEKITPGIAAPEIAEDPVRAATITNRTDILTKLLRAQGKIINVYSKEQT